MHVPITHPPKPSLSACLASATDLLMTWANLHAPPSAILGYTALQPLASALLTVLIVHCTSQFDLEEPGWNLLGGVIIIGGLFLLIYDNTRTRPPSASPESLGSESLLVNEERP